MKKDETKLGTVPSMDWGSDIVAEILRRIGVEYICLNPGSSFRGLHDSLVNYLGNDQPKLLLALHEESAVAIAHGYAKAAGRPMAAVVHSNVGLMHAMMAIFNAWCDRVPILIFGATGAVDATVRRNWVDWNHTVRDQGAMVRHFVKWDDQPSSPQATVEAVLRANLMSCSAPCGPSYVILDRRLQEDRLTRPVDIPDLQRFTPSPRLVPSAASIATVASMLNDAARPVLMLGRVSRSQQDWGARVRLAERLGARVITDLRSGAAFPTNHPLHGGPADLFLSTADRKLLAQADVVLSFDWPDLADALLQAREHGPADFRVVHVSLDHTVHNGWSGDHQRLPPVDVALAVEPDAAVAPLLEHLGDAPKGVEGRTAEKRRSPPPAPAGDETPTLADLGAALTSVRKDRKICLARVPLNWPANYYDFEGPLDYLGYDGGGGVGSGPGMTIGAALALEGTGRITVGIIGDGEFLAAPTALWTAAHYRIPMLMVVANNRSYFTDEIQQETVALERGREVENRWIGQRIDDPPADIPGIARDFGVGSEATVTSARDLGAALERGLSAVERGEPYLIDVLIDSTRGASFDWLQEA
jgi:thiamine pyrophosphate-dependent acetolactate synthase large subunit-like protein